MPPLTSHLNDYLSAIAQSLPDKRPLYNYRLADETTDCDSLTTLAGLLAECLQGNNALDRYGAAVFCLVMARRGVPLMESHPLTWKNLVRFALGLTEHQTDTVLKEHNLPSYADTGLGWWQRPLIRLPTSVRYLSSLWCEGGGPLNYIRRDYNTFRMFFTEVLRLHEDYPQRDIESFISEEQFRLRDSLRNDTVRDMTRAVIGESAHLRKLLRDNHVKGDPLTWLDDNYTAWRHRWPFPLDDEMATRLVGPMVSFPRATPQDTHPRVDVSLDVSTPRCVLSRTLLLPKSLSSQALSDLSQIKADDQPLQQWWILAVDSREYPIARLFRPMTSTRFTVDATRHAPVTGADAARRVTLLWRRGAQVVFETQQLEGNDPMPEGPWIFEDLTEGGTARYVGGGSWVSPSPTLIVVTPLEHPLEENPQCVRLGELQDMIPQRLAYRLSHNLDLHFEDSLIRLRVNENGTPFSRFALRGRTMTLGAGGSEVWLGRPALFACPADGLPMPAPSDRLQWRANGETAWQTMPNANSCLGDIQIRCLGDDHSVLYHQRLKVLPAKSTIRFFGTNDPDKGRVLLNLGDGVHQVDLATQAGLEAVTERVGSLISIAVTRVAPNSPQTFRCRVSWGDHRVAELVIPIPVCSVSIHDAAGRSVPAPGPIPYTLLDGLTLRATFPMECKPLLVDNNGEKWLPLIPDTEGSTAFHLPLSAIAARVRTILAAEEALNGVLTLYIRTQLNQTLRQCTSIRFQITAGQLFHEDCDDGRTRVWIPDSLRSMPWFQRRQLLQLHRFDHFDEPLATDITEPEGDRSWIIDRSRLPSTGALAVVKGTGGVCLSPLYLATTNTIVVPDPGGVAVVRWDDAVRIAEPVARRHALKILIHFLTQHLTDTDWDNLDNQIFHAIGLPASTYDAVGVVADMPLAAALCAIRTAGRNARVWPLFEDLRFLWSMIPIRTWLRAIRVHLASFPNTGPESLQGFLHSAFFNAPCMRAVVTLIVGGHTDISLGYDENEALRFGEDLTKFDLQLARRTFATLYAHLCDAHRGDGWPGGGEVLGPRTKQAITALELNDIAGSAKTVVYGPIIAAARMAYSGNTDPEQIARLIHYRAFDHDWYDAAQSLMTHFFLNQILEKHPHAFRDPD
jgi:hypothetical protein